MVQQWEIDALDERVTEVKQLAVGTSRAVRDLQRGQGHPERRQTPPMAQTLTRLFAAHIIAFARKTAPADVAAGLFADDPAVAKAVRDLPGFIRRAVTNPALTTVPGWAQELVQPALAVGILPLVAPDSAYARLSRRGIRLTLTSMEMRLPTRNAAINIAAAFIGEAQRIPVKQAGLTNIGIVPRKCGVISFFSRELADSSTPNIESVIRMIVAEDTGTYLDGIMLGSAAATAVAPPGLFYGVTPIAPATGGGAAACAADIGALLGAIAPSADPVLVMSQADYVRMVGLCPAYATLAVVVSDGMAAKSVGALDAAALVTAEGDDPRVNVSEDVVLSPDTAPGAPMTSQTLSLWQMDFIALRLLQDVTWGMRAAGKVAIVESVTW